MKRFSTLVVSTVLAMSCHAQTGQLLPGYNSAFYPNVLSSAEGVGMPYLLMQNYKQMPGVSVQNDSFLVYNKVTYRIHEEYLNPQGIANNGYYVNNTAYRNYNISAAVAATWPLRIPNALYDSSKTTFNATLDCVGYGTRLLAATGSPDNNAYLQLMNYAHQKKTSPFAARGWVASAYEIAAAFPTLPNSVVSGWEYVTGNVNSRVIDSLNHADTAHKVGKYRGVSKGGFKNAQPGDILAFGYTDSKSNGHFMVIEKTPVLLDSAGFSSYFAPGQRATLADSIHNVMQAHNVYAVPLYDCSGKNAHFNDSRKYMSGIGHGTILLLTDKASDTPQGFIFAQPKYAFLGNEMMSSHVLAITVGRFTP